MAQLVVQGTQGAVPLPKAGSFVLGRGPSSDFRLQSPHASRRHLLLRGRDNDWQVRAWGDWLLNSRVGPERHVLQDGDVLQLQDVTFRFEHTEVFGREVVPRTLRRPKTPAPMGQRLMPDLGDGRVCTFGWVLEIESGPPMGPAKQGRRMWWPGKRWTLGGPGSEVAVADEGGPLLRLEPLADTPVLYSDDASVVLERSYGAGCVPGYGGAPLRDQDLVHVRYVDGARVVTLGLRVHEEFIERDRAEPTMGSFEAVGPDTQCWLGRLAEVARYPEPAWVTGEPGTPWAETAKTLHVESYRARSPLCLHDARDLQVELLLHDVLVEDGGTVLIEHVDALSPEVQAQLAVRLELRQQKPSDQARRRVVVTGSRLLDEQARMGVFRRELLAMLREHIVRVPPLRERVDELEHMVKRRWEAWWGGRVQLTNAAWEALRAYDWPGNDVELDQVLRRARQQARGRAWVDVGHLDLQGGPKRSRAREELVEALLVCGNNQTQAAKRLGLSRQAFLRRAKKEGVL